MISSDPIEIVPEVPKPATDATGTDVAVGLMEEDRVVYVVDKGIPPQEEDPQPENSVKVDEEDFWSLIKTVLPPMPNGLPLLPTWLTVAPDK